LFSKVLSLGKHQEQNLSIVNFMGLVNVKDLEAVSPVFRGEKGHSFAKFILRIFSFDKVNRLYDNSSRYTGAKFAASILDDLGVKYVIGNAERLRNLPEGAFITVSNHPYGGLDGIIMIDMMAGTRPDYKFMVNKILSMVKAMDENFISVTPKGNKKKGITATSINGIRETLTSLRDGHPVGFFPSGAVSDFSLREMRIRDRKWQESILHLIHSAKVPILPIRFFDTNSAFFYSLGLINWRIRLLRQPSELFNKNRKEHRIGIGNIISVQEQEQFDNCVSLGTFLRGKVYKMPLPSSFIPRTVINFYKR
jgi:putative hemolysin